MLKSAEGELEKGVFQSYQEVLEHLFYKFNRDDRPNGQTAHSLSVGDVVVLNNMVCMMGFAQIEFNPVVVKEQNER